VTSSGKYENNNSSFMKGGKFIDQIKKHYLLKVHSAAQKVLLNTFSTKTTLSYVLTLHCSQLNIMYDWITDLISKLKITFLMTVKNRLKHK
jgi:hypothetical protein